MIRATLIAVALASCATAAAAQDPHAGRPAAPPQADPHAGHGSTPQGAPDPHAGHGMPATPAADPHAGHQAPPPAAAADPHAGHTMPGPSGADPHAGHTMAPVEGARTAADLPVGTAAPPPVIRDNTADAYFGRPAMDRARSILANEHGAARIAKVMSDKLEYQTGSGQDGYRWDVEAWWGGDINRLVLKSEGEGATRDGLEGAEIQALYSRPVARYTDFQVGVRQDFTPRARTYATVGLESLFPYWFEAEGALFLSDEGDLLARLKGSYDLRLNQRLVLQPEAELEFSAQNIPEAHTGSGLSTAEVGLRLRYEIRREFAPYIGVSYERAFGETADFVRADGEDVENTSLVIGLRAWF